MKRYRYIVSAVICSLALRLIACSNHTDDKLSIEKIISDSSSTALAQTNIIATDTSAVPNDKLTKIYTQAIAEFIKAAYKKNKTAFDTLYFGKHVYGQPDDFPNIELPATIENTHIKLVTPEVGQKKQAAIKSLVYVNMMGWVDNEKAEFVLVVFTNGAEHQYDYYINFKFNTTANKFELHEIAFENYLQLNGQKPQRITIYKNGKYIEGK